MAAPRQPDTSLVFGPFVVLPASGEILKYGVKLKLARQPAQLLLALLRAPGELVSRESLREELWAGNSYGDFEHGLNAAMNRLRQVLNDDAASPRYIETVPGHGYRFIAPVTSSSPRPALVEIPLGSKRRRRWLWLLAPAALLGFAFSYWLGSSSRPPLREPSFRFPIEPPPGAVFEPSAARQAFALSADGMRLASTARGRDGVMSIWLHDLQSNTVRQLPGSQHAYSLHLSPEGRNIYFSAKGKLMHADWDKGTLRPLTNVDPLFVCGIWQRPNELIFGNRYRSTRFHMVSGSLQTQEFGLAWPQALPGADEALITGWNAEKGLNEARFARPDSRGPVLFEGDSRFFLAPSVRKPGEAWILYLNESSLVARPFDLRARRVINKDPQSLLTGLGSFRPTGAVDAALSARTLVYLDHPHRSQLAVMDRSGREIATVGPVLESFKYVRLSHDAKRVALSVMDKARGMTRIWTLDLASGALRKISQSPALEDSPVWSPGGGSLVVAYAHGQAPRLAQISSEDGAVVDAFPRQTFQLPSDWSADGRFVALTNTAFSDSASERNGHIYLVDMKRNNELVPLLDTQNHESGAVFSPDGKAVAFLSDESGRTEAYVQAFDSVSRKLVGQRKQISSGLGASVLRWPKPGSALYFLSAGGYIYEAKIRPGLEPGPPDKLFEIPQQTRFALHSPFSFDVLEGGAKFLVPAFRSPKPAGLTVLVNWQSLLED